MVLGRLRPTPPSTRHGPRWRRSRRSDTPRIKVIGVVGDVRNPDADRPPEPHIYLPVSQSMRDSMAMIARTTGDRMALGARVSDVMATVMHRGVTPVLFGRSTRIRVG